MADAGKPFREWPSEPNEKSKKEKHCDNDLTLPFDFKDVFTLKSLYALHIYFFQQLFQLLMLFWQQPNKHKKKKVILCPHVLLEGCPSYQYVGFQNYPIMSFVVLAKVIQKKVTCGSISHNTHIF